MPKKKKSAVTLNRVTLDLSERGNRRHHLIVNGVDIAGMVESDWTLTNGVDEHGTREARLTVTFPVVLS